MKRFYKTASTGFEHDGITVLLDGKLLKTPSRQTMFVPTQSLADEICREWGAQKEEIIPDTMPMTQLLTTVIDRITPQRAAIIADILNYIDTDLVCYVITDPPELQAYQQRLWTPVRDWFEKTFNTTLNVTTGILAIQQNDDVHMVIASFLEALDDNHLGAFQLMVSTTGSVILSIAFYMGVFDADHINQAIFIDEDYKAELYNEEFYGRAPQQEVKEKNAKADLYASIKFKNLLSAA
jgi:chaperone required for assembly of F1-ATPase